MAAQNRLLLFFCLSGLFSAGFACIFDTAETFDINGKVLANANRMFDAILPSVQNFILRHGLDPMQLDDISESLPSIIANKRSITLTNGWLQGLSNLRRASDVTLSYKDKVVTLDVTIGFDILNLNYKYLLKDSLITRKGDVDARINDMQLRAIVAIDFNSYQINLNAINVVKLDKLNVMFEGHALDPIINAALKSLTNIFRKKITSKVQSEISNVMQKYVDEINGKIPRPGQLSINDLFNYIPTSLI
ncbi:uncharacterized protein LOC143424923 [Xylocopa sonorina]|uniref:uncharacterized protein LOC143424923 n=1 Tax=Xylocopa sonorina TaxID=1818115 RepID=UPI00403AED1B